MINYQAKNIAKEIMEKHFDLDGDTYWVSNVGAEDDGKVFVHAVSTTRYRDQKNGRVYANIGVFIDPAIIY